MGLLCVQDIFFKVLGNDYYPPVFPSKKAFRASSMLATSPLSHLFCPMKHLYQLPAGYAMVQIDNDGLKFSNYFIFVGKGIHHGVNDQGPYQDQNSAAVFSDGMQLLEVKLSVI